MKATYKTTSGRLMFEISGEDVKAVFKQIASVQEVFDAEAACGICKCKELKFQARHVDDFDFYELACTNAGCRARFAFGQAKKGGALFPKRKDEDGKWLPNGGWAKYEKPGEKQQATAGAPTKDGVPEFPDWETADAAMQAGVEWLRVAGALYKLSDDGANYRQAGK